MSIISHCAEKIGSKMDTVYVVLKGYGFTVLVMEKGGEGEPDWLAFGYVLNHNAPDCSELGYLDLREYEKVGMRIRDGFKPCKLADAKKMFA